MKIYLEKKAIWQSLKTNLEKNIKFTEELNNKDNSSQYSTLLFKFSNLLTKTEEKLAICEAKLSYLKVREENSKINRYFFYIILIIFFIFCLGNLVYKKWKQDNNKSVFDGF